MARGKKASRSRPQRTETITNQNIERERETPPVNPIPDVQDEQIPEDSENEQGPPEFVSIVNYS
jgi:hypothetical protein